MTPAKQPSEAAMLTPQELAFLYAHEVPLSRVFDARGFQVREWKSIMSTAKLWIAYGTTPCQRAGHRLRTRKGHCVQCNTATLAFLKRHDFPGSVYVAYSSSLRLVKIGCTANIETRQRSLVSDGYAGASDWRIRFHCNCSDAGRIEFLTQRALRSRHTPVSYFRQATANFVCASELFRCSLAQAKKALDSAIKASRTLTTEGP